MNLTQIPSSNEYTTYLENIENTIEKNTFSDAVNINNSDASFFSLPAWLFFAMISISTWIIVANSTVLLCLVSSRNAMKNNVYVQLLSLSFTDLLVGITTIPGILFPILFQNTRYETCALMIYMYFCAQSATLCHSLLICANRLLAIMTKRIMNANAKITSIWMQVLAVWGFCLLFYVIHFLSFARFGERVEHCSTIYLFGDNEFVAFGLMTIPSLVPPQLCTNIIYVYLFMHIRKRLRTVGTVNVAQTNMIGKDKLASYDVEENMLLKLKTLEHTQANELVSINMTGHGSSNSSVKTNVQSKTQEPVAGPSTDGESKCKGENYADRNLQTPAVNTRPSSKNDIGSQSGWKQQKRAMVTFGILLMSMNIFMTPLDFIGIIQMITGPLSRGVRFLFVTMAMLNSAFNPLINIWRIRPFRVIMREKATTIYESLRCRRT